MRCLIRLGFWRGVIKPRFYSSTQQQHLIPSPFPDVVIPAMTLPQFIWQGSSAWQNKTCIECAISGRHYTYAQARDATYRFSISLQRLGLRQRDVLAIVLPNTPDYLPVLMGAVEAGTIVTTVNPSYTAGEISRQFQNSSTRCVVTDVDHYPTIRDAVQQTDIPIIVVGFTSVPQGTINFNELISKSVDISSLKTQEQSPEEAVILPYSSGTTGMPKGVMLSHRNLICNMLQINDDALKMVFATTEEHQDVIPAILPFFHIYGFLVFLYSVALGSKIVTLPKFDPATFLRALSDYKASLLFVAPPLALFLASHPGVSRKHLESVRAIMSGAAPLGAADVDRLRSRARSDLKVIQGYGMTETSPFLMQTPKDSDKVASVGPPVPSTCAKVVDLETGASLGPGQLGELCVRGPQVMLGYLNNPEATAEIIDSEGWLHTGDLGDYDESHHFYIRDRIKELIKVKGYQVPPAELEELLRSHPNVADAAVIGIPNERAGELPKAIVIAKPNSRLTGEELMDFVATRVAPYKQLAGGVVFVDSIPKSSAGKILRRHLRQLYKD